MIFDKFLRFDIHFPPIFTLFLGVSDNPIPPIPIPSDLISSYPYPLSLTLTTLIRSIMDNIYMNDQFNITQLQAEVAESISSQLSESDHLIIESDYDWHHAQLDDLSDLITQALYEAHLDDWIESHNEKLII